MADETWRDPLDRVIVLRDRTWFGHIVRGHPEVLAFRKLVERAVRQPVEIRQSRSDSACRLYFGPGPRPSVMIMVVADVEAGYIKTAHLVRKISGGDREWSPPTP